MQCEVPKSSDPNGPAAAAVPTNVNISGSEHCTSTVDLETRLKQDLDTYNKLLKRDQKIKNDFISKNLSQKFSFEKYVENLKCNQSVKQPEKSKTEKLFQKIENVKNWNLDLNGEQFNAIYGYFCIP